MNKNEQGKRKLTPEEYRRALIQERRRTMRTVRNTLLVIALLAGVWFLILLSKERKVSYEPAVLPMQSEAVLTEGSPSDSGLDQAADSAMGETTPSDPSLPSEKE